MVCPHCGNEDQIVTNTRSTSKNTKNWRRRKCTKCFKIFTTYEAPDLRYVRVIKKDGSRVVYKREKIYASVFSAFIKTKNSDSGESASQANKVVSDFEYIILRNNLKEIKTRDITILLYTLLKKYEYSVAINYVSYYLRPSSFGALKNIEDKESKLL